MNVRTLVLGLAVAAATALSSFFAHADPQLDSLLKNPSNWAAQAGDYANHRYSPLKQINRGQLEIDGTQIRLRGEVDNEASRQQIASTFATSLNPTYKIVNGLRVSAGKDEQDVLDNLLSNRVVEFETGSTRLTARGRELLDRVADAVPKLRADKIQIIGHTDSSGSRSTNLALSQARADAVRDYLVDKGLPVSRFEAMGAGPDQPVATNATAEGRAKNRRIEFRAAR